MPKVIANEWTTLDGVVQAPSYADEDVTGGFRHGGWHARYLDDLSMNWVIENVRGAGGYLLGRSTFEIFAAQLPSVADPAMASGAFQGAVRTAPSAASAVAWFMIDIGSERRRTRLRPTSRPRRARAGAGR